MIIDSPDINAIQLSHQSLRQPDILILITQFHAPSLVSDSADKSKIFRSCTAYGYFVFLLRAIIFIFAKFYPHLNGDSLRVTTKGYNFQDLSLQR